MAACILVIGLIGLIEAVTITSTTMDHARRQTLASQMITHEIEQLYLSSWATISALPTASTAITIDPQFDQARTALGDNPAASTSTVRFTMARTVTSPDPVTNIKEVNFTVTWVVTTSRLSTTGARITFTYSRSNSAWYGKNGLHLSYQNT